MSGYQSYQQSMGVAHNPRDTEYRLIGNVTSALIKASEEDCPLKQKISALLWNQKVWNAFLSDLAHPENVLPEDLKNNLIKLATWVFRETQLVMDDEADFSALINVNKTIMEGLRPQVSAAAG